MTVRVFPRSLSLHALAAALPAVLLTSVSADISEGLWVGRAVLSEVNEVVSAVDEDNVRVQTPPGQTTPTSDTAEVALILHVDAGGQVRLLKGVAIVDDDDDPQGASEKLITDPALFANYTLARRIAAAAFEFGDPGSPVVIGAVAEAAALAAAAFPTNETAARNAAEAAAEDAVEAAEAGTHSDSLGAFIQSSDFQGSPAAAASAAGKAVVEKYAEGLRGTAAGSELVDAVQSEVLIALGTLSQMADGTTLDEVAMDGVLVKGGVVEAEVFLGAYHPSNPFRHRRHPSHRGGYNIERHIRLTIDEPEGGDDFDVTDRGLDRLTGVYEEEVFGLHKPLGQNREFGLKTKGGFVLDRISRDATLND